MSKYIIKVIKIREPEENDHVSRKFINNGIPGRTLFESDMDADDTVEILNRLNDLYIQRLKNNE